MKVIGTITPEWVDNIGIVANTDYIDGKIIAFSKREAVILEQLQRVSKGYAWQWEMLSLGKMGGRLANESIADALRCVYAYTLAKFQVNKMRQMVDDMDSLLKKIEADDNEK